MFSVSTAGTTTWFQYKKYWIVDYTPFYTVNQKKIFTNILEKKNSIKKIIEQTSRRNTISHFHFIIKSAILEILSSRGKELNGRKFFLLSHPLLSLKFWAIKPGHSYSEQAHTLLILMQLLQPTRGEVFFVTVHGKWCSFTLPHTITLFVLGN